MPDLIATQRTAGDALSLDVGSAQGSLRAAHLHRQRLIHLSQVNDEAGVSEPPTS